MNWAFKQLFAPLNYLRIKVNRDGKQMESKTVFDLILPVLIAAPITVSIVLADGRVSLTGNSGVMQEVKGLIQILVAFFIAALAAVSTFSSEAMSEPLDGRPAELLAWDDQAKKFDWHVLSRRQFVCYLFGYLSLVSFAVFVAIVLVQFMAPSVHAGILYLEDESGILWLTEGAKALLSFLFFFVLANMITTTALGLYFLSVGFHGPK